MVPRMRIRPIVQFLRFEIFRLDDWTNPHSGNHSKSNIRNWTNLGLIHSTQTETAAAEDYEKISLTRSRIFRCMGLFSVSMVAANFVNSSFCSLLSFDGTTTLTVTYKSPRADPPRLEIPRPLIRKVEPV